MRLAAGWHAVVRLFKTPRNSLNIDYSSWILRSVVVIEEEPNLFAQLSRKWVGNRIFRYRVRQVETINRNTQEEVDNLIV